jgi:hypothetical protein
MPLCVYSKRCVQTRQAQALLLSLLFSAAILLTLPDYGISHDEPIYMEASRSIRHWPSLDLQDMLNRGSIEQHWKTVPFQNVHPSGVKWLYVIDQPTVLWEKDPYIQGRLFDDPRSPAVVESVARSAEKSPATAAMRVDLAAGFLALLALDLHNPARHPPYELSCYNSSVGGLGGAYRGCYETT